MLRPADQSPSAKRRRRSYEVPDPDFEVDATLLELPEEDAERIPRRAEVRARIHVGDPIDEFGVSSWGETVPKAKMGEPLFALWVVPTTAPEDWPAYWITLSTLFKNGWTDTAIPDDYQMFLDAQTREQMLIWWDEHGAEVEARVTERPSDAEIERHLARAGLSFGRERSGGADWGVPVWGLGNNLYLAADDNREFFSLVRRDMRSDDDEIEELTPGLDLLKAIERVPHFLRFLEVRPARKRSRR